VINSQLFHVARFHRRQATTTACAPMAFAQQLQSFLDGASGGPAFILE
jgi:hypothetical protein